MVNLKNLKSNKRKLGLLISLTVVSIGVIPLLILTFVPELKHSYTIEPMILESEDGIRISAFKYTPEGQKNHGGVVVGHSFFGNKLNMQPLSIELVKRGFTVINIDFRGHGASGGSFYYNELIKDIKAAVDYIEQNLTYISEIGLVGHSLGAQLALSFSNLYPEKINATVAIGSLTSNINNISNLLIAAGLFDSGLSENKILEILRSYTGQEDVVVGQIYSGDFNGGKNIKGYISPFSGHLTEIMDSSILFQTVQWFEQAFNGELGRDVFITATILQVSSYVALFGIISLIGILILYIRDYLFKDKILYPEKDLLEDFNSASYKRLLLYYTIPVVTIQFIFYIILSDLTMGMIPFTTATITLSLIIGSAIGIFIVYNFLLLNWEEQFSIKDFFIKIKSMISQNSGRSIIYGILVGILVILSIAAIWHWSVQNSLPTLEGLGRMVLIILISFPFFLIKEFYYRNVQGRLKMRSKYDEYLVMVVIGIIMDNLLILFILFIGRSNLAYIPAYALYLIGWVIFSIIQHCSVTYIYMNSGRNILGSAIFISIFYSWMLVVFFPTYGFL
ncbi:MAG: alpha/beta fold hydrolase [Candidatus Lokiarchaeota archaeon]|nr:alpha/beta fold hydrolase [Candidatus Lokiarchaeota archaeon]